jgi:tRNA pseudouridine55 synthase
MHGWIILDKPLGLSSAQGVAAIKRLGREAGWSKLKIGHGGTLDPLATGVLPIALGEATKLTGRLLDATKAYRFTIAFGAATATDDAEGAVTATSDMRPARAAIEAVLPSFTGPIVQTPPAYSALKVDGRRAYALARAGEAVELAPREVTIHTLALVGCDEASATLDAHVSKGTYIRSLARDIALALGGVGHVSMLRRTRAGPFGEGQAISLDKLTALGHSRALEQALLPLTAGLDDIPVLPVEPAQAAMLRQGRLLDGRPDKHGLHLATDGSVPVALVDVSADGVRVVRGFNI